jgi:PhnB protein
MKFLVMVKGEPKDEGQLPSLEAMAKMAKFNEELVKAGVMKQGEGLMPSAAGAKMSWRGGKRTVVDGPFTEARELVGGFWIWECESLAAAKAWAEKIPFLEDSDIEIRQIATAEHYAPNDPDGKIAAREEKMRAVLEAQAGDSMRLNTD